MKGAVEEVKSSRRMSVFVQAQNGN